MKILSWDVGIIHLAYCLMEVKDNEVKILDWNNLNLLEQEEHKCHGFIDSNNKSSECNKKCLYFYQTGGKRYNFCLLHKNQFLKINKEILELRKFRTNLECENYLTSGKKCSKKGAYKLIKDGEKIICSFHANLLKKKENNNTVNKITKTNASKAPIDLIKYNLIKKLDQKLNFLDVSYVLIENQPSLKNPKMKSVANTLYSWFLIRGLIDKKNNCNLKKIMFLSPSNKLKINDDDIQKELNNCKNDSKKYQLTKKMAVVYTRNLIKNESKWLNFLNNNKKKDDLCDSYLQGLYFINNIKKFT